MCRLHPRSRDADGTELTTAILEPFIIAPTEGQSRLMCSLSKSLMAVQHLKLGGFCVASSRDLNVLVKALGRLFGSMADVVCLNFNLNCIFPTRPCSVCAARSRRTPSHSLTPQISRTHHSSVLRTVLHHCLPQTSIPLECLQEGTAL